MADMAMTVDQLQEKVKSLEMLAREQRATLRATTLQLAVWGGGTLARKPRMEWLGPKMGRLGTKMDSHAHKMVWLGPEMGWPGPEMGPAPNATNKNSCSFQPVLEW